MRPIVATLLALHMFAHGAFGCCLHHGHTWGLPCCQGDERSRESSAEAEQPTSCCRHRHACGADAQHHAKHTAPAQPPADADEDPQPTAPCDRPGHDSCAKCVFHAPSSHHDSRDFSAPLTVLPPPFTTGGNSSAVRLSRVSPADGRPPPLRAHLLFGVLLL